MTGSHNYLAFPPGLQTTVKYTASVCGGCNGFDGHHWDFCPYEERRRLARIAARPLWKKLIDRIKAAYEADDLPAPSPETPAGVVEVRPEK